MCNLKKKGSQKSPLLLVLAKLVIQLSSRKNLKKLLCQNHNFQTTIFIWLQSLKNCNGDKKVVKATRMIVLSTDTVVVCIGTKRDCQCHRYLIL